VDWGVWDGGKTRKREQEPRPTGIERWFGRGAWKRGRVDSPIPYGVAIQPASDRGVLGACLCSRYAGNLTWSPQRGEGRHCKCDGVVGFQWTRNGDGAEGLSTAPSGLLTHCTAHMHECLLESSTAEQQARYWSHWPVQLHLDIDGVYHTYSGAPLGCFKGCQ